MQHQWLYMPSKVNCYVNAHAVNDNFVCISNRRKAIYTEKRKDDNGDVSENEESKEIFTCDVFHFFSETLSKSKKNDHQMHNVALDKIVTQYKRTFPGDTGSALKHIIVWTDNAPTQYACRQTFLKNASFQERHPGITITHRLAVVDKFKGNHDSVGKDPIIKVRYLESIKICPPTANDVFVNMQNHLERPREESDWIKHEEDRDARIKNK